MGHKCSCLLGAGGLLHPVPSGAIRPGHPASCRAAAPGAASLSKESTGQSVPAAALKSPHLAQEAGGWLKGCALGPRSQTGWASVSVKGLAGSEPCHSTRGCKARKSQLCVL